MPGPELGGSNFEDFAASTLPALLRFGYVLTGSRVEAEDLAQEALAKSLRRWRRVSADDPVAYVRRVMVNTHLTRWRRWGARVQVGGVPELVADDAGLARSQDWDALRRALAQLPSRQRAVLVGHGDPIDTATNTALAPIDIAASPGDIAIAPNGRTAYLPDAVAGTVIRINTATNTVLRPIKTAKDPTAIAFIP